MNNDELKKTLSKLQNSVDNIEKFLRILTMGDARETIEENISEDWEKVIYNELDGEKSTRDLASKSPVARLTLLNRLKKWRQLGLIKKTKNGKYKKLLSLKTLGINVPKGKQNDKK